MGLPVSMNSKRNQELRTSSLTAHGFSENESVGYCREGMLSKHVAATATPIISKEKREKYLAPVDVSGFSRMFHIFVLNFEHVHLLAVV